MKVVESITAMHSEETGAPRYLVQVIFYEVDAHAHYIGGKEAPEEQNRIVVISGADAQKPLSETC